MVTFQKYQNYFGFRRKNILLGARGQTKFVSINFAHVSSVMR